MIKILRLDDRQKTQAVLQALAGEIKKIEVYASASVSGGKVQLKKALEYFDGVYEYIDTIATGTKTSDGTFTLADGTVLYSVGADTVTGYRNGYWDLTWEDDTELAEGAEALMRHWTLTSFGYVEGVKTTVKAFTGDTAVADGFVDLTLATSDEEPEEAALEYSSEEASVTDNYCSGSVNTRTGWERKTRTQTTDLCTVTLSANGVGHYAPKDSDSSLPYYLAAGDTLTYAGGDDDMKALTILVMVR